MGELEELSARGRDRRAKRSGDEHQRSERAAARERRLRRLIAKASTVRLGWLITGEPQGLALLLLLFVGSSLATKDERAAWPIALHGGLLLLLLSVKLLSEIGYRRERAWVASLPFALPNHLDALGDLSRRSFGRYTRGPSLKLELEIDFRQPLGDDRRQLVDALAGFDGRLSADGEGASLRVRCASFPGGETNYPLHRFMRRLTSRVLLPIHERHRIAQVRVSLHT